MKIYIIGKGTATRHAFTDVLRAKAYADQYYGSGATYTFEELELDDEPDLVYQNWFHADGDTTTASFLLYDALPENKKYLLAFYNQAMYRANLAYEARKKNKK